MQQGRILIVDDEAAMRHSLEMLLESEGYEVEVASDAFEALSSFDQLPPALTITDLTMPGIHGLDLLRRIRQRDPNAAVVVVTGSSEVDSAVDAMRAGALDYLVKPLDADRLLATAEKAVSACRLRRLSEPPPRPPGSSCEGIIGTSPEMLQVFRSIEQVGPTRATVLVTGESGTGKEVVARAIHRASERASAPFVALNCAALSSTLLESELFGHERGSFTGADKRRQGRIEQANGGTLFLDEIGEICPAIQVKLLRVLQERSFERVGGNDTVHVDVRLVTATNQNLRKLVAAGKFREDLLYRLDVVALHLPPLRERRADIPALAMHFLKLYAAANASPVTRFSDPALQLLANYDWPGNVRQLQNAVEHGVVFARGGCIELEHLPPELQGAQPNERPPAVPGANMLELERYAILKTMAAVGGSTRKTAELLGMSIRKVQYRLRQYGATPLGS
jgi:two-component system response regulator HydG